MGLLDEIGARLSSQGVASSSGEGSVEVWKLVLGHLPDSTQLGDTVVAVLESGGLAPDAATEVDRPTFQVITRGESLIDTSTAYQTARAKASCASSVLHAVAPGQLGASGNHYTGIWAQQEPFFAGLDEKDRPMFSQNFLAMRSRT